MKRIVRITNFILVFLLTVMAFPLPAKARGFIDLAQKGDMTLTYECQKAEDSDVIIPIIGERVEIFRVASVDEIGQYTLLPEYRMIDNLPVTDLKDIQDQDTWKKASEAMAGYIYKNGFTPSAVATTDEKGQAHFTSIELGLYFVNSVTQKVDNCVYSFGSFLIAVPGLDANDEWINPAYYVVGTVKCKITVLPNEISYELLKSWNDAGFEADRPTSISVTIYCDGNEFATVTLGTHNNWRFEWLYEDGHVWTFAETVNGSHIYTSSIDVSGSSYRLTNTYVPPETPPDNPGQPDEPGTPDLPEVLGAIRDLPAVLGAKRLPQTGQLWWPLPVLLILGVVFIITGIRKNKKNL